MGSWDVTCSITSLPIQGGDDCVVIAVPKGAVPNILDNKIKAFSRWCTNVKDIEYKALKRSGWSEDINFLIDSRMPKVYKLRGEYDEYGMSTRFEAQGLEWGDIYDDFDRAYFHGYAYDAVMERYGPIVKNPRYYSEDHEKAVKEFYDKYETFFEIDVLFSFCFNTRQASPWAERVGPQWTSSSETKDRKFLNSLRTGRKKRNANT